MASSYEKKNCSRCPKGYGQVTCNGCGRCFCLTHLNEHRQELNQKMDDITIKHDHLQQALVIDENFQQNPLMVRVDRWETESIEKIKEVANNVRLELTTLPNRSNKTIAALLHPITDELRHSRETQDFTEMDLAKWMKQLKELREELDNPPLIEITNDKDESSSIHLPLIQLRVIKKTRVPSLISSRTKWLTNGVTVAGGHEKGHALNQLNCPYGLDIDDDGTLLIADRDNHRVMRWKPNATKGEIIDGVQGQGNPTDQLDRPTAVLIDRTNNRLIFSDFENGRTMRRSLDTIASNPAEGKVIISNTFSFGLALDNKGSLYVSDWKESEVRRYGYEDGHKGVIVAGGNGLGAALNQLNGPRNVFVDDDYSVYVSDRDNHRVMKWMKNARKGIIVAGGQGLGNRLGQLSSPSGMFVDRMGSIYVADQGNHRVMRWLQNGREGEVIVGGNGRGSERNQLNGPGSISLDHEGNLYVVDQNNHRVQRFDVE